MINLIRKMTGREGRNMSLDEARTFFADRNIDICTTYIPRVYDGVIQTPIGMPDINDDAYMKSFRNVRQNRRGEIVGEYIVQAKMAGQDTLGTYQPGRPARYRFRIAEGELKRLKWVRSCSEITFKMSCLDSEK